MDGQVGRVRLAIASASPKWSEWPWVTTMMSHAWTSSGDRGLLGFLNQGSNRIVLPPGVRTSQQACPNHVNVALVSRAITVPPAIAVDGARGPGGLPGKRADCPENRRTASDARA